MLIALVDRGDSLHVLLTKRAEHLKHHPGQVSFPGGKYEESDKDLSFTAVREACEEVGLKEEQITVVGELPALPTISKFAVTPFIAFVDADYSIELDDNEVAEAFEVPASFCFPGTSSRVSSSSNIADTRSSLFLIKNTLSGG
ncbi:hypothetical nudix hydrolase yeaB [Vibrio ishigakensis]|uniref:Hypothetical nudix hydrolase yeaB n=1 Tax=Vibrio ishigakensis TaxID=1481914 RepID=A0A0B8P8N1_9VIBR|nr:hypothetical nudix hydrolase yeaB [Vibrio ishigakensis]